jgi:hypothetical protein
MRNSLNSSPLCEVSFAHTCANTFFKKYHSHLKWVLKGFHSEIMLSSIDKFLYLLTRTLHSYKSESSVIFLSKKYIPLYKETVQNGATLCKECHIIWKVPLHKGIFIYIYTYKRMLLWKQISKMMLELACFLCFRSGLCCVSSHGLTVNNLLGR